MEQLAEAKDLYFDKNLPGVPGDARAGIDLNKVQEEEAKALWRLREHFGTGKTVAVAPTFKKRSYNCSPCKKSEHSRTPPCTGPAKKARRRCFTKNPLKKKQRKTLRPALEPVPESESEAEAEAESEVESGAGPGAKIDIFAEFEALKKKQEDYMAKIMGLNMVFQMKLKSYQNSMA